MKIVAGILGVLAFCGVLCGTEVTRKRKSPKTGNLIELDEYDPEQQSVLLNKPNQEHFYKVWALLLQEQFGKTHIPLDLCAIIVRYSHVPHQWKHVTTINLPPFTACTYVPTLNGPLIAIGNAKTHNIDLFPFEDDDALETPQNPICVKTPKAIKSLPGHTRPIHKLLYAPSTMTLISESEDKTVWFWSMNPKDFGKSSSSHKLAGDVRHSAFSSDGLLYAATMTANGTSSDLVAYSLKKRENAATFSFPHYIITHMAWSHEKGSKILVVHGYVYENFSESYAIEAQTKVLDVGRNTPLKTFSFGRPHPKTFAYLSHHKRLLYGYTWCGTDQLAILSATTGKKLKKILSLPHPQLQKLIISPRATSMALISEQYNDTHARLAFVDIHTSEATTTEFEKERTFKHYGPAFFATDDCFMISGYTYLLSGSPRALYVIKRVDVDMNDKKSKK